MNLRTSFHVAAPGVGSNYCHSVRHLPEEQRLQNGPTMLGLDSVLRGSKQERHYPQGTKSLRFNSVKCVHVKRDIYSRMIKTHSLRLQRKLKGCFLNLSLNQAHVKAVFYTRTHKKSHIWKRSRMQKFMQPPTSVQDTDVQTNREKKPGEKKKLSVCLQKTILFWKRM